MDSESKTTSALGDQIYRTVHSISDAVDRPREQCKLAMRDGREMVEDKMDARHDTLEKMIRELVDSQNALAAKIEHIFDWKDRQEKKEKKIIGGIISLAISAVGYTLYSIFEYAKKKFGLQ